MAKSLLVSVRFSSVRIDSLHPRAAKQEKACWAGRGSARSMVSFYTNFSDAKSPELLALKIANPND
ncbi:MAG TPA: hypothetical protein VFY68_18990 [Nitrososphaeraceae archaeon]|nr:hypothetical protein [Nitrososphaeraceae archaeon]